jgi:hypothetical protein
MRKQVLSLCGHTFGGCLAIYSTAIKEGAIDNREDRNRGYIYANYSALARVGTLPRALERAVAPTGPRVPSGRTWPVWTWHAHSGHRRATGYWADVR